MLDAVIYFELSFWKKRKVKRCPHSPVWIHTATYTTILSKFQCVISNMVICKFYVQNFVSLTAFLDISITYIYNITTFNSFFVVDIYNKFLNFPLIQRLAHGEDSVVTAIHRQSTSLVYKERPLIYQLSIIEKYISMSDLNINCFYLACFRRFEAFSTGQSS